MIKVESTENGTHVAVEGELICLLEETLSVIDSVLELYPNEVRDDILHNIPTLVKVHRSFLQSQTSIDTSILDKILGENNADR